jgi:hypothetical protein
MALPRFTAETSLYRTNRRFSNGGATRTGGSNGRPAALVVPQVSAEGAMQCLQSDACIRCITGGGSLESAVSCATCDACLIQVLISSTSLATRPPIL